MHFLAEVGHWESANEWPCGAQPSHHWCSRWHFRTMRDTLPMIMMLRHRFMQAKQRAQAFLGLSWLVIFCFINVGCLDLLVRGIIDPSGLASDVGTAVAADTARSVIAPSDVQSLQELDRTISRLDTLIADGDESMAANDLKALRQHIAEGRDQLVADEQVTDEAETVLTNKGPFAYSPEAAREPARRLGDPSADPSWIAHQPYRQRQEPPFSRIRHNNFQYYSSINKKIYYPTGHDLVRYREHDNGTVQSLSNNRLINDEHNMRQPFSYGIDLATGQLHRATQINHTP